MLSLASPLLTYYFIGDVKYWKRPSELSSKPQVFLHGGVNENEVIQVKILSHIVCCWNVVVIFNKNIFINSFYRALLEIAGF